MTLSPKSGSILIVDDEESLRQTLARILEQAGYQTTTAADGQEALHLLAEKLYDLVYLDIHLPRLNGLQVLGKIQQLQPELPVVLFTAHASLQSALEAIRLGATDYLIKPVKPEMVLERTAQILKDQAIQRRRREIQQQIAVLQAELNALDRWAAADEEQPPVEDAPPTEPLTEERFLQIGPIMIDLLSQRVTLHDELLNLPPTALDYLVVLARRSPEAVAYEKLVEEAQGYETDRPQAQDLAKWHIHTLRQALEPDPRQPRYILNVRGIGYRLIVD